MRSGAKRGNFGEFPEIDCWVVCRVTNRLKPTGMPNTLSPSACQNTVFIRKACAAQPKGNSFKFYFYLLASLPQYCTAT